MSSNVGFAVMSSLQMIDIFCTSLLVAGKANCACQRVPNLVRRTAVGFLKKERLVGPSHRESKHCIAVLVD